jgi:hypothetical protein
MDHTVELLKVYLILNAGVSHGTQPIDACSNDDPLYVTFHYGMVGRTSQGYDPYTVICTRDQLTQAYKAYEKSKDALTKCIAPTIAKQLGGF